MAVVTNLVIDASFLITWLMEDESNPAVDEFIETFDSSRHHLVAPSILTYEIINSLRNNILRKRLNQDESKEALQAIAFLNITTFNFSTLLQHEALSLAVEHGCSVYDASYIALARAHKLELLTLDQKLAQTWEKIKNF